MRDPTRTPICECGVTRARNPARVEGEVQLFFTRSKSSGHVAKREDARASEARGEIRGDASSPMPTNFEDPVV